MRTTLLLAALLLVGTARASVPEDKGSDAPLLAQAPTKPSDDEDEEEAPKGGVKPPEPTKPGETPAAPATAPKPAAPAAVIQPPPPGTIPPAAEMKLVSGAPLFNPNVKVHIVEQKQFSDSGKRELVLYPVTAQVNGKFTEHLGTMGSFVWHLQENFGLMLTGGYNWYNQESSFNSELVDKFRIEAQAATSLLQTWDLLGGVEVTPLYGKFTFFENNLAHFGLVLIGGAGAGGTRHLLKPEATQSDGTINPATFGDTGVRFMGTIGAGFRLSIGSRFSFRLEVRDVVYTARVEKVNGCDVIDLKAMRDASAAGKDPTSVTVSASCRATDFAGVDPQTGYKRAGNIPLAYNLVKPPVSSDVLNNVGVYLGASFLF
jgi:outer membrane beta-barrel protein